MSSNQWRRFPGQGRDKPGWSVLYETFDRRYRASVCGDRVDYVHCKHPGEVRNEDDFLTMDSLDDEIRRLLQLKAIVAERDGLPHV